MSHRHFCDYAGHYWDCDGFALRPLAGDTEPSKCYCLRHRVPMDDGDHSACPIELLECPEHRQEKLRDLNRFGTSDLPPGEVDRVSTMFQDDDPLVGFCLWCGKDFYSMGEVEAHNANDSAACAVFQELKERY